MGQGGIGAGLAYAKELVKHVALDEDVGLIPCNVPSTTFTNGDWVDGGVYMEAMVIHVTAALAAAPALSSKSRIIISLGEGDAGYAMAKADFIYFGCRLIKRIKAIPGMENAKVLWLPLVPEMVAANPSWQVIQSAQQAIHLCVLNAAYVPGRMGNGQTQHWTAPFQRLIGPDAYYAEHFNLSTSVIQPAAPTNLRVTGHDASSVSLSWDATTSTNGAVTTDFLVRYKLNTDPDEPEYWIDYDRPRSLSPQATVSGLAGATNFNFRAYTIFGLSLSAASNTVSQTTQEGAPPQVITDGPHRSKAWSTYEAPFETDGMDTTDVVRMIALSVGSSWSTPPVGIQSDKLNGVVTGNVWTAVGDPITFGGQLKAQFFECYPAPDKRGPNHTVVGTGTYGMIAVATLKSAGALEHDDATGNGIHNTSIEVALNPSEDNSVVFAGIVSQAAGSFAIDDPNFTILEEIPKGGALPFAIMLARTIQTTKANVSPIVSWSGSANTILALDCVKPSA
jgi:hypothetical protein